MRQFDVCRLRLVSKAQATPAFFLVLQADLLDAVDACVVAPVVGVEALPTLGKLRPELMVEGRTYRVIVDRLSVLRRKDIGAAITSAKDREWDIRPALNQVFAGV